MLDKLDTFTNKHLDAQLSVSRQKKIQKLLKKDVFKVVTSDKVVILKVSSSSQVFNSFLIDNIKNPYTNKAYEKNRPIVHTYNDEKKNLVLIYLLKLLGVSQGINSCFIVIIQRDDNNNIKFYLQDIMQAYVKIASNFYLDFYIRLLSKLIS